LTYEENELEVDITEKQADSQSNLSEKDSVASLDLQMPLLDRIEKESFANLADSITEVHLNYLFTWSHHQLL